MSVTLRDAEDALAKLRYLETNRSESTKHRRFQSAQWRAAYNLQLYGMKWEVILNARSMNESIWRKWMSKRYPKNHLCLLHERAQTTRWDINWILPSETDF